MNRNEAIATSLKLLPAKMSSNQAAARVTLLVISKQEDPEGLGYQKVNRTAATRPENYIEGSKKFAKGPARGIFQFEQGGGVKGVLNHASTAAYAKAACFVLGVEATPDKVWLALEKNPVLAAAFARMLMWTDPGNVPAVGQIKEAFSMYLRLWRPGAYTRGTPAEKEALWQKFQRNYIDAMDEASGPEVV